MAYAPLLALVAALPLTVRRWRHLLCIGGHKDWDDARLVCWTCRRTYEEIRRGWRGSVHA